MARMPEQYEQHFHDLTERPRQLRRALGAIVCTEDRGVANFPYAIQLAGGAHGIAIDMHTAATIERGRPMDLRPGQMAADARIIAAHTGATSHEECAADNFAASIDGYIADKDNFDTLFRVANELVPDLVSEDDVVHAQVSSRHRLRENGLYIPEDKRIEVMTAADGEGRPVRHLALHHNVGHAGTVMVANDVPGSFADTRGAFEQGQAMYGFTIHAMGDVALNLAAVHPLKNIDSFLKASTIRQGAATAFLPNGVTAVYRGAGLARVA